MAIKEQKNRPCYKCEKRCVGCHSTCPDYKDFDEANKIRRDMLLKRHLENQMMISYKHNKLDKMKRK